VQVFVTAKDKSPRMIRSVEITVVLTGITSYFSGLSFLTVNKIPAGIRTAAKTPEKIWMRLRYCVI
jgi:hypothetical protein